MAIEDALATWLGDQRWFAGKGQSLRDLAIVADTELVSGDPELRHLIVAVSHGTAVDYYQVFVGLRRRLPARLKHARIGPTGGGSAGGSRIAYDGLHDADLTKPLLAGIAAGSEIGSLRMRAIPGARFNAGRDSLVLGSEQSNTSLVYGEESILKVFRRLSPGPNPDLEVTTALARLGSPQVAEPLGWIETRLEGVPTSLAILSRYLRLATDGWTLAATSVRDLYAAVGEAAASNTADTAASSTGDTGSSDSSSSAAGGHRGVRGVVPPEDIAVCAPDKMAVLAIGRANRPSGAQPGAADAGGDFAGEARRLGIATAQVHADLAAAFGTDELRTDAVGELTERMYRKLDLAVAAVPELAKHVDMISDAFSELAKLSGPFPVQRVHGDYHLGQVLRTETGWVVLDFEGEPATPLAQRRARSSPLRDVAGMLRSFDYAARHQLIGHPGQAALSDVARDWVRRNASAFCVGYAEAGGLDPVANQVLLRALQLDKAVYEVLYEARHRPSWLPIPLESLAEF
jgi:maltokinase